MGMKSENILPFNWRTEIKNFERYTIDDDIILIDKPIITSTFQYPYRMDVAACFICIRGTSEGSINLKTYTAKSPCLVTFLPGHIAEYKSISEYFVQTFIESHQENQRQTCQ